VSALARHPDDLGLAWARKVLAPLAPGARVERITRSALGHSQVT